MEDVLKEFVKRKNNLIKKKVNAGLTTEEQRELHYCRAAIINLMDKSRLK